MTIATGEAALAADVLDGANMPSGAIIIWTGTIVNIPTGWLICDGNNSTPNLLTRFIEGVATAATDPGTTGGATAKTSAGTAITIAQMPAHTHSGTYYKGNTGAYGPGINNTNASEASAVPTQGGGGTHTHGITDIRPKYYDVAFLMKS